MNNPNSKEIQRGGIGLVLYGIFVWGVLIASWITHVVVCFQGNRWGFLIAGALMFPIAIIHGIGIWFGFW